MPTRSYTVFLSAGEASGDHYGAQLIEALKPHLSNTTFTGLGGTEMEVAGQQRVVRAEDVAVMGITEILRHIPHIYRSYRKLVRSIKANKPDVAILIDFPDVNFRLARHLHRMGVPVFWFVSPQLWAWKRQRLRWVQKRVSKMFVIFPFELPFYRNRGVDAHYVGHPLADLPLPTVTREEFASNYGLNPEQDWIALLPGSRRKEIELNLPEMLAAARQITLNPPMPPKLKAEFANATCYGVRISVTTPKEGERERLASGWWQFVLPVAATASKERIEEIIRQHQPLPPIHLVDDARAALFHSRASVVASGTATVQAALIGNPFLVVYKVSNLTFRLAKWLIRYPAEIPTPKDEHGNLPIAMPNLIAGKRIVPELINKSMNSHRIMEKLEPLLEDSTEREQQIAELAKLRASLKLEPDQEAITHLRDAVLQALSQASSSSVPSASNG